MMTSSAAGHRGMSCLQAGPTVNQTSNSVVWMYRSTADGNQQAHQNAGLYGPIIVARRGFGDADGKANDVDREFVTVFFVSAPSLENLLVRLTCPWPECLFAVICYPMCTSAEFEHHFVARASGKTIKCSAS